MRLINFTVLTSLIALLHNPHCEAGGAFSRQPAPEDHTGTTSHTAVRSQTLSDDVRDIPHVPTTKEIILYNETSFRGIKIAYPKSAEFEAKGRTLLASVEGAFKLYYFGASEPDELDKSFNNAYKAPSSETSLRNCLYAIYDDLDKLSKIINKEEEVKEAKGTIERLIEVYKIAALPSEKVKMQRTAATGESLLRLELDNDTIVIFSVCARPSF